MKDATMETTNLSQEKSTAIKQINYLWTNPLLTVEQKLTALKLLQEVQEYLNNAGKPA